MSVLKPPQKKYRNKNLSERENCSRFIRITVCLYAVLSVNRFSIRTLAPMKKKKLIIILNNWEYFVISSKIWCVFMIPYLKYK